MPLYLDLKLKINSHGTDLTQERNKDLKNVSVVDYYKRGKCNDISVQMCVRKTSIEYVFYEGRLENKVPNMLFWRRPVSL